MKTSVAAFPRLREAEAALADDRIDYASAIVIQHLRANPNEPRGLALLGSIAFKGGALVQAEQFLRQAMQLGANSFEIRRELASILHHQERLAEALSALTVLKQQSQDPSISGSRALILDKLGRSGEAIREHESLIVEHPENPRVWVGYGNSLRWAGRNDEAIAAYRRATSIDPEHGDAWWALANIKARVLTDEDIATMNAALKIAVDERNIIPIHFALGRGWHDRQAYDVAFEHFATGNRLRAQSINFAPEDLSAEVDEIIRLFDEGFFERRDQDALLDQPIPVFLISLPRSGSTLLEQMLDQHLDIEAVGELSYARALVRSALEIHTRRRPVTVPQMVREMSPGEARAFGQDYMHRASLHWNGRPRYFIDKMPMNWTEIPFIWRILPQARFIEIRRNAMDCCFSNFIHYFSRAHSASFSLEGIGQSYVDLARLMAHLRTAAPDLIHSIRYEKLIERPEPILRETLEYLGLDWDPTVLTFYESDRVVRTPSVEQVHQPLNRKGLGTWKPYSEWLGPLRDALGPLTDETDQY